MKPADPVGGCGGLLGQIVVKAAEHRQFGDLLVGHLDRAQGLRQGAGGVGDDEGVPGIFSNTATTLGIHAGSLGNSESVGGHGAGKDRAVGRSAFDHPEGVCVGVGATCHPFDGPVDAGCCARE